MDSCTHPKPGLRTGTDPATDSLQLLSSVPVPMKTDAKVSQIKSEGNLPTREQGPTYAGWWAGSHRSRILQEIDEREIDSGKMYTDIS